MNDTPSIAQSIRDMATDALRYWEPRRLVYNGVLALVVVGYFLAEWPASKSSVTMDSVLHLFLLAVFANVLYCAAYVADGFVQLSGFRGECGMQSEFPLAQRKSLSAPDPDPGGPSRREEEGLFPAIGVSPSAPATRL